MQDKVNICICISGFLHILLMKCNLIFTNVTNINKQNISNKTKSQSFMSVLNTLAHTHPLIIQSDGGQYVIWSQGLANLELNQ